MTRLRPLTAVAVALSFAGATQAQAASHGRVAIDAAGTPHLSFRHHDGSKLLVKGRTGAADGTLGEPDYVSPTAYNVAQPVVAAGPAGSALVAWWSVEAGGNTIRMRRRSADGSLGPVQTVAEPGATSGPKVVVAPNGEAVVAWARHIDGKRVVEARRRSAAGALGPVKRLSGSSPAYSVVDFDLAIDPAGNAVATWVVGAPTRYVQVRRLTSGGTLSTLKDVTSPNAEPTNEADEAAVAVDRDGNALVVFRRRRDTRYLAQGRRRSAGGTLSPTQDLSAARAGSSQLEPRVAADPTGAFTVAWTTRLGDGAVEAVRRLPDGTLGPVAEVAPPDGRYLFEFDLGVDDDGDAVVAWVRQGTDAHRYVQARRRAADGTLSPVADLSPQDRSLGDIDLGVEPDGDAVVLWLDLQTEVVRMRRRAEGGDLTPIRVVSE